MTLTSLHGELRATQTGRPLHACPPGLTLMPQEKAHGDVIIVSCSGEDVTKWPCCSQAWGPQVVELQLVGGEGG